MHAHKPQSTRLQWQPSDMTHPQVGMHELMCNNAAQQQSREPIHHQQRTHGAASAARRWCRQLGCNTANVPPGASHCCPNHRRYTHVHMRHTQPAYAKHRRVTIITADTPALPCSVLVQYS
jgi:hypothetical protein